MGDGKIDIPSGIHGKRIQPLNPGILDDLDHSILCIQHVNGIRLEPRKKDVPRPITEDSVVYADFADSLDLGLQEIILNRRIPQVFGRDFVEVSGA